MSNRELANFSAFSIIKSINLFLTGSLQTTTLISSTISSLSDKKEPDSGF
jgi:hypothetical protein